jgi:hypothetical protein
VSAVVLVFGIGRAYTAFAVVIDEGVDRAITRADLRLVAYHGTLPIPERANVLALVADLDAAHKAGDLTDQRYLRERIQIQSRLGSAVAVFSRTASPS